MNLKYISVLCFLAGATAYGQVKTNQKITEEARSNAFLDASENTDGQAASIGKGLLFPQTDLSTFKLDINAADGVNYPTYFDGMIVYNTKEGGKTSDPNIQVTDNLQKGFYYFSNPTGKTTGNITNGKWIKLSDTQANDQLWAQRTNNSIIETYLKPADASGDYIGYNSTKKFAFNLGNVTRSDVLRYDGYDSFDKNEIPFSITVSSDQLPLNGTLGNTSIGVNNFQQYQFNKQISLLKNTHVVNSTKNFNKLYYNGITHHFIAKNIVPDISGFEAVTSIATFDSNSNLEGIKGTLSWTDLGGSNPSSTAVANYNTAIEGKAQNYGYSKNLQGGRFTADNYNKVDNVTGVSIAASSRLSDKNNQILAHTVKVMYGIDNVVNVSENATVETGTNGIRSASYFRENSTNPVHYGIFNYNRTYAGANVDKLYGARYFFVNDATATIGEMYGLYIDNVNKGTTKNYAIYTGLGTVRFGDNVGIGVDTPVEKLEVAGNILAKEAELRSERSSNIGGSLELSNTLKADTTTEVGKWRLFNMKTGGAYNYISGLHFWAYGLDNSNKSSKMVLTDEGKLAIGYGSNASEMPKITELLNVNGNVKATAFMGTNGAKLFPDYVFQKYYTGTSNIKADYSFKTLSQVEDFVKANGHLPGYQSAAEIKKQGYIDIMATQLTNVEKIEELYLHLLEKDKEVKDLKAKNEELESRLQKLEALLVK
ncbi:hypothetical protein JSO61_003350 [Riemerella anatipestifer]|uniref:hypothetical protein n=1 Tax=Riemerella anatipestifer TaxID=34085 RepID=UPI0030BA987F